MAKGEQLTVCWHVDDLKSSHINPKVNDEFLQWIKDTFGQLGEVMIQFPPEMDENWLRYELLNLGQILGPNWQRMLSCAYTTQLLHSTGEVCWNNKDSYFIWFKFVCRKSGK